MALLPNPLQLPTALLPFCPLQWQPGSAGAHRLLDDFVRSGRLKVRLLCWPYQAAQQALPPCALSAPLRLLKASACAHGTAAPGCLQAPHTKGLCTTPPSCPPLCHSKILRRTLTTTAPRQTARAPRACRPTSTTVRAAALAKGCCHYRPCCPPVQQRHSCARQGVPQDLHATASLPAPTTTHLCPQSLQGILACAASTMWPNVHPVCALVLQGSSACATSTALLYHPALPCSPVAGEISVRHKSTTWWLPTACCNPLIFVPVCVCLLCRGDQCAPHLLCVQACRAGVGAGRRRRHQRRRLPAPDGLPRVSAAGLPAKFAAVRLLPGHFATRMTACMTYSGCCLVCQLLPCTCIACTSLPCTHRATLCREELS